MGGRGNSGSRNTGGVAQPDTNSTKTMLKRIQEERPKKMKDDGVAKPWNSSKMYTYDINGKQIKTNYGAYTYSYWDGDSGIDKPHTEVGIGQTLDEVMSSLIDRGYDTIQIKQRATRVSGFTETVLFYSNTLKKKG